MEKRFTFSCWNCLHTYTLFREITDQQELIVSCPYCGTEAVAKLPQYGKKTISVWRGIEEHPASLPDEYVLPDVIPTEKPA